MSTNSQHTLPEGQRAIRERCFHPQGEFTPFPSMDECVRLVERFESQVDQGPDRPAVRSDKYELDYAGLNALANNVSQRLSEIQDDKSRIIALLADHDAPAIGMMLGVLKSGHAYLPLDATYPVARLEFMLRHSGTTLIICDESNAELARKLGGDEIPTVEMEHLVGHADNGNPCIRDSGSIVLYTSGSTGRPKGYTLPAVNILQDVMHYTNAGHFCPHDRFLLLSSFSFADSIRTIYSALLNGAALYPYRLRDYGLAPLKAWMERQEITIYRSVPTVFRHFCRAIGSGLHFPSLRLIYLSGEPVYKSDFELYRNHFYDHCILVNRLGSGEALTYRCNFIDKSVRIDGHLVPVGYPVADKTVRILDNAGHLRSSGQGEIVVNSEYLTPGYLNLNELNRNTFRPDPGDDSKRLYLTGDLGELSPDGCLTHLGRKDFQLKIRGHRIEPAEIEQTLLQHRDVAESLVNVQQCEDDDARLVAYIVPANDPFSGTDNLPLFVGEVTRLYVPGILGGA